MSRHLTWDGRCSGSRTDEAGGRRRGKEAEGEAVRADQKEPEREAPPHAVSDNTAAASATSLPDGTFRPEARDCAFKDVGSALQVIHS